MKNNKFKIKINLLVFGIMAIITLGSQASQLKADTTDIDRSMQNECDVLYADLDTYVTSVENHLAIHDYAKAKKIFDYKVSPKHNKWRRYCSPMYKDSVRKKEKKDFATMKNKVIRN